MDEIETLGIIDEIQALVSDKLQVVQISFCLSLLIHTRIPKQLYVINLRFP